ncbi:WXG100 family type VII secretion target [Streptomyces sp. NPDC058301]|uniref:WXG100 family type VII secretion target n=1 Tax=Streptomyces sp. NPDC058301 TaxID=3346436 RepID=UPI0036E48535
MSDDSKVLDIKTADLKATAPTFHEQSVAVERALATLRASLATAGAAWGDDDPGTKFHDKYGPLVTRIEQSAGIIKDGLASIHLAMSDMADGHIDNDALVGSMFRRAVPKPHERQEAGDHGRGQGQ